MDENKDTTEETAAGEGQAADSQASEETAAPEGNAAESEENADVTPSTDESAAEGTDEDGEDTRPEASSLEEARDPANFKVSDGNPYAAQAADGA